MEWILGILFLVTLVALVYLFNGYIRVQKLNVAINGTNKDLLLKIEECHKSIDDLQQQLEREAQNNSSILSSKKSTETKMGMMVENIVPLLTDFPYNTSDIKHLSMPVDYICFEYDKQEIVFLEVKSGNAKESKRQKLIKDMIKQGKVHYDLMQINSSGIKVTRKV